MKAGRRSPVLTSNARSNRGGMTPTEVMVWRQIRHDLLGVRFRRQHPLGRYILDFACVRLKLAVEIDGSQHLENLSDLERDAYLRRVGWTVLRFSTYEVVTNLDGVIRRIVAEIERLQCA